MPVAGKMDPILVLLPGLDGTGELFAPFLQSLGGTLPTQVVSYPRDQALGYAQLEPLVSAGLPTNRPFVLLAESFSGPLAIRVAANPPPGLVGLILCASFARAPCPWWMLLGLLLRFLPMPRIPPRLVLPLLVGNQASAGVRDAIARLVGEMDRRLLRARLLEVLRVNVQSDLASVQAPTLFLRASQDRLVSRTASDLLLRLALAAHSRTLDGPHLLLQAKPDEVAKVVIEFLNSV